MNRNSQIIRRLRAGKSWIAAALVLLQIGCSANNDPSLEYQSGSTLNPSGPSAPDNSPLTPADPHHPLNWFRNGDIESGVAPWYPLGGGMLLRSNSQKHSGSHSLLISGRTAASHAPAMPLLETLPSGQYEASIWARLVADEAPAQLILTLKTRLGNTETYTSVRSAEVTADGWTRLSGTFQNNSPGRWDDVVLYVESPDETVSYYVDDLTVVSLNNLITNGGVENGIQPWRSQGGALITQASEQRHSGENSLLVTGRTANWNGPVMDLPALSVGRVYGASVWARLAPGTPATQLNLTLKRTVTGGEQEYIQLGSAQVGASAWVQLSGSFTHLASGELQEHFLYIESTEEGATASFYVDDLALAISQNAITNGDFEAGTGGWFVLSSQDSPVSIERVSTTAVNGTYSLSVTHRNAEWHGAATNLNLTPDVYRISCHFQLAAGSAATTAKLTVKINDAGGEAYVQIATAAATAGNWLELAGPYIFDPDGAVTEHHMYVHAEEPTAAYLIDACAVTPQ